MSGALHRSSGPLPWVPLSGSCVLMIWRISVNR